MDRITTVSIGGAGVSMLGGLAASDIAALGGLAVTVLTFCVNIYYKHKHYKLAKERGAH